MTSVLRSFFRIQLLGTIVVVCLAGTSAAQTGSSGSAPQPPTRTTLNTMVTAIGCVEGAGTPERPFRLSNSTDGTTARLTGTDIRPDARALIAVANGESRAVGLVTLGFGYRF